jgi:cyclase
MSFPRFIPILLLQEDGLVKTEQFKKPKYIGDPINAVKIFNEKQVDELVFIDIDASKNGDSPNYEFIQNIATECFMPLAYGGGIKTLEQAKKIIKIGVEKLVLNSVLFDDMELVKQISNLFGKQAVAASVDVKKNIWGKYCVYRHDTGKTENVDILEWCAMLEDAGVGEIILTSVDREGTQKGFDLELYKHIQGQVSVPIVAHGGASSMEDCSEVLNVESVHAIAAGSFFVFHGEHRAVLITYPKYADIKKIFLGKP